jgi:hypothetical protein
MAMISACQVELQNLCEELEKREQGHRLGWERLKGAFQASKTRDAVVNLRRRCQDLNQLLSIDTAALAAATLQEVTEGRKQQQQIHHAQYHALNHIRNNVDDENARRERDRILNWLTRVDYASQQNDFFSKRQPGTGKWLLDTDHFKTWVATKGQMLFCQVFQALVKQCSHRLLSII